MDIRHMTYFIEVARQKSFSRAAETLHISQSAISKMVKDMEEELGLFLFNRNSKAIQLTDAGAIFLNRAQKIVSMFQDLIDEVKEETMQETGRISIGLPPITGATSFAQLLGNFKQKFPKIEILLFEHGSKRIESGIQDGSLDIGVICNSPNVASYNSFSLTNDPIWVIAHPQNPISQFDAVNLQMLNSQSFVIYRDDFSLHHVIVDACKEAGFQPKIIFQTSQRELMTQIVEANLGIALLPSKTCKRLDSDSIKAIPLLPEELFHKMSVIWKKDRYLSHAAKLWIDFAKAYLLAE